MKPEAEISLMRRLVMRRLAALARDKDADTEGRTLSAMLSDYPGRGGKMIRSTLCLLTVEALGGDWRKAVSLAASIEALHNFFLIHDDIEDVSGLRRGLKALHRIWGVPLALNAGDALCGRAMLAALEAGGPSILRELLAALDMTTRGQHMELWWVRDGTWSVSEELYLKMCRMKTAYYSFVAPMKIGAISTCGGAAALDDVDGWGSDIGAAFQVNDDLLNYSGGARFGKELLEDVREGKRTVILLDLLRRSGPIRRKRLIRLLPPAGSPLPAETAEIARMARECGSIDRAADLRDRLYHRGFTKFEKVSAGWPGQSAVSSMKEIFGNALSAGRG